MKTKLIKTFLTAVILVIVCLGAISQQTVKLLATDSKMIIRGTSTFHDWEEIVEKFDVNLAMEFTNREISGIDHVHLICKSGSITSDNSLMTSKTMDALHAEKYPDIVFKMVSVDKLTSVNGKFSGILIGELNLAGVTKHITLLFSGHYENNRIIISGSKDINMSDYMIKPPTAMLGTLKTGETVVISFQLQFRVIA